MNRDSWDDEALAFGLVGTVIFSQKPYFMQIEIGLHKAGIVSTIIHCICIFSTTYANELALNYSNIGAIVSNSETILLFQCLAEYLMHSVSDCESSLAPVRPLSALSIAYWLWRKLFFCLISTPYVCNACNVCPEQCFVIHCRRPQVWQIGRWNGLNIK